MLDSKPKEKKLKKEIQTSLKEPIWTPGHVIDYAF